MATADDALEFIAALEYKVFREHFPEHYEAMAFPTLYYIGREWNGTGRFHERCRKCVAHPAYMTHQTWLAWATNTAMVIAAGLPLLQSATLRLPPTANSTPFELAEWISRPAYDCDDGASTSKPRSSTPTEEVTRHDQPVEQRTCTAGCGQGKTEDAFSGRQWRRGVRRCAECVASSRRTGERSGGAY